MLAQKQASRPEASAYGTAASLWLSTVNAPDLADFLTIRMGILENDDESGEMFRWGTAMLKYVVTVQDVFIG